jgi:hypothetical protein
MKKVNMVVFEDLQLPSILKSFNIATEESKNDLKVYLKDDTGHNLICECCGQELHTGNVGNIMRGSTKIYCKSPSCFTSYLLSKKL